MEPPTREELDAWLKYHADISFALSKERQSLESALIPVTAYILISALECYRRHAGDDGRRSRRRCRPRRSARSGASPATRSTVCTCGRSRTSVSTAARSSPPPGCSIPSSTSTLQRDRPRLLAAAPRARSGPTTGTCRRGTPTVRSRRTRRTSTRSSPRPARSTTTRAGARRGSTRRSRRTCSSSTSTPAPATRTPVRTSSPTVGCSCCVRSRSSVRPTSPGAPRSQPRLPYTTVLARVRAARRAGAGHRLRDVGHRSRGLPPARRGGRVVLDRGRHARADRRRGPRRAPRAR